MTRRTLTLSLSEEEYQLLLAEHQVHKAAMALWAPGEAEAAATVENIAETVLLEQLRENNARRRMASEVSK